MKSVVLYGELGRRFGKYHRLDVKTPAEALRALCAIRPGFESYLLLAHQNGMRFRVGAGREWIDRAEETRYPIRNCDRIRIVPVLQGAKDGFTQALVGASLIVVAAAAIYFTDGAATPFVGPLGALGLSMVIGGVANILTKPPGTPAFGDRTSKEDGQTSYLFNGPANTSAQGIPVPVGYGRMIVGSAVISAAVQSFEVGSTVENLLETNQFNENESLQSRAYLAVIDLISEGEIVGLVNGARSIYFDQTPYQNADGTYNFQGVEYDERFGTVNQIYMPWWSNSTESEIPVNVRLTNESSPGAGVDTGAVVRTITDTSINRVRVKLMTPGFYNTDLATGNPIGTVAGFRVYVQPNGGSYTLVAQSDFVGKTSSRYERSIDVPLDGDGPWNLKVLRWTLDNTPSAFRQDTVLWESYTEIVDAKLRYPTSAYLGVRINAQQFQNIPSRYYDVKLLKILIPTNYDPVTRAYTGDWDGTFQRAWSDNPAWVFYDLCTSSRYGLGSFIDSSQIDKWALYSIAQYCDELVNDGFGGTEPRFTCNLMMSDRGQAYSVLQGLASVFRGMVYWAAGAVTAVQDAPLDASYLFTPANVVDGRFAYQGASNKARHSVALVTWNDPDDFCRPKVEYVEDQEAIAQFGVQQIEVSAVGCTSRGQAHRLGKWILYTEQNESETVLFKAGLEGIALRPGQIIKIADPVRAGARMGGRISAATTSTVTIDQDPDGSVAGNTILVLLPDGSVAESTVVGQSGRVLTVQPELGTAPNAQSVWMLRSDAVEPATFRVISISEQDGSMYNVTALRHDPDKFAAVESGIVLSDRSYSSLSEVPTAPQNVQVTEALYQSATEVRTKITVSWDKVALASAYQLRYRKDDDNFVTLPESSFSDQEILDVQPGVFTVQVWAINALGIASPIVEASKEVFGKTAPPADIDGFSMIPNGGQAYLTWTQSTDLDVLVGGQVRIRHTPKTSGQSWFDAVDIIPAVPGASTSALAPLLAGTYLAKFVDSSGNYSDTAAEIVTTVPGVDTLNIIENLIEDPTFDGAKSNMLYDSTTMALALASGLEIDDFGMIDDVGNWDLPGDIETSGSYDFDETVDLGGVWPVNLSSHIDLQAVDLGNFIDARTDNIDDWQDIDGSTIDDVDAQLYMRTTLDDPSGSPTWTAWKIFRTASYEARGFQFQLRCTSGSDQHNMLIKELRVSLDLYDRVEHLNSLTSGTAGGGYRVTYAYAFWARPSVGVTAFDMVSGDYFAISSADETGFTIVFKNTGGTVVSRSFDATVKGYGTKVA